MLYTTFAEAILGGWCICPRYPVVPGAEKPSFPDGFLAYQSAYIMELRVGACATGATPEELLTEINRVTKERSGK